MLPSAASFEQSITGSIARMVPGFNGYLESENRRSDDRAARDFLAKRLQECKRDLQLYVQATLASGDLEQVLAGEKLREQIDHLQSSTRSAFEGYSSWFDAKQIDPAQLKSIVDLDSDLVSVVDRLHQQILRRDTAHQESPASDSKLDFDQASQWVTMFRDRFARRAQLLGK